MKITKPLEYFVFTKQGYDRAYYCVAGREISHNDAVCFLTHNEAHNHANNLSKNLEEKASNEPGSTS
jgi:hypothetical protein